VAEGSAKEDLGGPAPGQGHEAHAFLEVAVAVAVRNRFRRTDFQSFPRSWLEHDSLSPKGNRPLATRTISRVLTVSFRNPTLVSTPQPARFDNSSFVEDDAAMMCYFVWSYGR
jgi:hypothetical protein